MRTSSAPAARMAAIIRSTSVRPNVHFVSTPIKPLWQTVNTKSLTDALLPVVRVHGQHGNVAAVAAGALVRTQLANDDARHRLGVAVYLRVGVF